MATARTANFPSHGINVVSDLYLPSPTAPNRKNATVIVGHPGTGIKEQASSLYAKKLAEHGFTTLAFDAAHHGESGGEPCYLEDPYQRIEDFKSAVTFLSTLDSEVNPERIGTVGICASGGYVVSAAQTDLRLKAVATVCGVCLGAMTRDSMKNNSGAIDQEILRQSLLFAGKDRIAEAKGSQPTAISTLQVFEEAKEYYETPRGQHPRCTNLQLVRSVDMLATYISFAFIGWISPRPLLMITGSEADRGTGGPADTAHYTREAIEGRGHLALYDKTAESVPKPAGFFAKSLCM